MISSSLEVSLRAPSAPETLLALGHRTGHTAKQPRSKREPAAMPTLTRAAAARTRSFNDLPDGVLSTIFLFAGQGVG